jgi:hypothetical protein
MVGYQGNPRLSWKLKGAANTARATTLQACHCGLDPQSMVARQGGSRIKSGMTSNRVLLGRHHTEIVFVDKTLII